MAHGERAERHFGREYWSKRLPGAIPWGRVGKWLTHRRERREARRLERIAKLERDTSQCRCEMGLCETCGATAETAHRMCLGRVTQ